MAGKGARRKLGRPKTAQKMNLKREDWTPGQVGGRKSE